MTHTQPISTIFFFSKSSWWFKPSHDKICVGCETIFTENVPLKFDRNHILIISYARDRQVVSSILEITHALHLSLQICILQLINY